MTHVAGEAVFLSCFLSSLPSCPSVTIGVHLLSLNTALIFILAIMFFMMVATLLNAYMVSYGFETWTYSEAINHEIKALEMWCYRRMVRISGTFHTINIVELQKNGVKQTTMKINL